mmetsp:Transcript_22512/g.63387  ORF Transcript_22512/g.63387 Transcript_22512/m.63387 type:complete len:151 (-) Transcript_22512:252-704(-)
MQWFATKATLDRRSRPTTDPVENQCRKDATLCSSERPESDAEGRSRAAPSMAHKKPTGNDLQDPLRRYLCETRYGMTVSTRSEAYNKPLAVMLCRSYANKKAPNVMVTSETLPMTVKLGLCSAGMTKVSIKKLATGQRFMNTTRSESVHM